MYIYIYIYMCVCVYVYIYIYVCVYIYIYICECVFFCEGTSWFGGFYWETMPNQKKTSGLCWAGPLKKGHPGHRSTPKNHVHVRPRFRNVPMAVFPQKPSSPRLETWALAGHAKRERGAAAQLTRALSSWESLDAAKRTRVDLPGISSKCSEMKLAASC